MTERWRSVVSVGLLYALCTDVNLTNREKVDLCLWTSSDNLCSSRNFSHCNSWGRSILYLGRGDLSGVWKGGRRTADVSTIPKVSAPHQRVLGRRRFTPTWRATHVSQPKELRYWLLYSYRVWTTSDCLGSRGAGPDISPWKTVLLWHLRRKTRRAGGDVGAASRQERPRSWRSLSACSSRRQPSSARLVGALSDVEADAAGFRLGVAVVGLVVHGEDVIIVTILVVAGQRQRHLRVRVLGAVRLHAVHLQLGSPLGRRLGQHLDALL